MSGLDVTLASLLRDRFTANATRIRELAAPLSEVQFWQKPFAFGNSFGHLVLHLTGNLNYHIGAQIANTGYIRDRPREFTDASPPSREEALRHFDTAIAMVVKTVREQSSNDWSQEYRHWNQGGESAGNGHAVREPPPTPHRTDDLHRERMAATVRRRFGVKIALPSVSLAALATGC